MLYIRSWSNANTNALPLPALRLQLPPHCRFAAAAAADNYTALPLPPLYAAAALLQQALPALQLWLQLPCTADALPQTPLTAAADAAALCTKAAAAAAAALPPRCCSRR